MYTYFCKNCNYVIGKWNNKHKYFKYIFCKFIESKNFNTIYFLDCINCKKFVGILCYDVCENCFGENQIYKEEKLFNWFFKYKKIIDFDDDYCKKCGMDEYRTQCWFFEELTFINKKFNILKKILFNFFNLLIFINNIF